MGGVGLSPILTFLNAAAAASTLTELLCGARFAIAAILACKDGGIGVAPGVLLRRALTLRLAVAVGVRAVKGTGGERAMPPS
ncbi:hypothetical protein C8Q74DRAFT_1260190 [Fomes fomentarius]|nr:hypothetical protein C8Q74DRAFT_1260190 [Fomes fomentarius]